VVQISTIAAAVLVLMAGFVGYQLGARQRPVESDFGALRRRKLLFKIEMNCEAGIDIDKDEASCEPLIFAQAHHRALYQSGRRNLGRADFAPVSHWCQILLSSLDTRLHLVIDKAIGHVDWIVLEFTR